MNAGEWAVLLDGELLPGAGKKPGPAMITDIGGADKVADLAEVSGGATGNPEPVTSPLGEVTVGCTETLHALPPATCERCRRACPCGDLPPTYRVYAGPRNLHDRADIRDALLTMNPPAEGTGSQRRTRILSAAEREALGAAARGQRAAYVPGRRPQILGR